MGNSDRDRDQIDGILAALPQENLPMTLSGLDGDVTGVLCCPDLIAPSEWLPHAWGETGDANFPDSATAELAFSTVMAHYNSVAVDMTKTPWIDPIYGLDPNSDETLWEPWVDGFARATRLRPETWQSVLERVDDEIQPSVIFLGTLQDINEGTCQFTDEEIDLNAPDLIPNCGAAILLVSRPTLASKADNLSGAALRSNQPPHRASHCPCGSGRQHAQCCGTS